MAVRNSRVTIAAGIGWHDVLNRSRPAEGARYNHSGDFNKSRPVSSVAASEACLLLVSTLNASQCAASCCATMTAASSNGAEVRSHRTAP